MRKSHASQYANFGWLQVGFEQLRVAGKRGYRVVMYTVEEVNRNRHVMGRFTEAVG